MISATVLQDSYSEDNLSRLTTLSITFHRYILPEFNTHRCFSRNGKSSRAIPSSKLIQQVINDPAIPSSFGKNKKGMSASEENYATIAYDNKDLSAKEAWLVSRNKAVEMAKLFSDAEYHKQTVNRILEPYSWTTMVVSSTEWDNFFSQRISEHAQPEIRELAIKMKEALDNSKPVNLALREWHLPYILEEEQSLPLDTRKKISVARCARVSYKMFETGVTSTVEQDIKLYEMLKSEYHLSPFEHIAEPMHPDSFHGEANFSGYTQLRAYVEEELYFSGGNND
jgi:thymidylate synthase ThyX